MNDRFAETAGRAQEKAAAFGSDVQNAVEDARESAAGALESAAGALHERAGRLPGGANVSQFAHRAAGSIQATAEYVRRHDIAAMSSDAIALVRKYPAQSLAAAAAMGFLVGRVLRRDD